MEIVLTDHVLDRPFNEKIESDDMVKFIEKLINYYKLYNQQDGFYKFRDNKLTPVIKKEGDKYKLITLYSEHYVMLNCDVKEFKCYFEGTKPKDRKHILIDRPKKK